MLSLSDLKPVSAPVVPAPLAPVSVDAHFASAPIPGLTSIPEAEARKPFFGFVCCFLFGLMLGLYIEDKIGGQSQNDRQEQITPDDSKNKTLPVADMVLVCEVMEMTPEVDAFSIRLKEYCRTNNVKYLRLDKEQGSAKKYVDFAATKEIATPFVAFSKDGKIVGVNTVEAIEGKMK